MTVSRNIEDLHKDLQPLCRAMIEKAHSEGLALLITCTYRSNDEQARLYQLGRTINSGIDDTIARPFGRTVTNAKAGESAHNFTIDGKPAAKAFDIVPLRNGRPVWGTKGDGLDSGPSDDATDDLELWQRLGKIGTDLGLNWYGLPTAPFREFPHFQLKE